MLTSGGISNIIDTTSTSIGKRYARTDELGVPFAVTVDYTTISDQTVTLRDRDSMEQVRKTPASPLLQHYAPEPQHALDIVLPKQTFQICTGHVIVHIV